MSWETMSDAGRFSITEKTRSRRYCSTSSLRFALTSSRFGALAPWRLGSFVLPCLAPSVGRFLGPGAPSRPRPFLHRPLGRMDVMSAATLPRRLRRGCRSRGRCRGRLRGPWRGDRPRCRGIGRGTRGTRHGAIKAPRMERARRGETIPAGPRLLHCYPRYRPQGGGDVRIPRIIPGKLAVPAGRLPMNSLLRMERVRVAYSPDRSRAGPIGAVRFTSRRAAAMRPETALTTRPRIGTTSRVGSSRIAGIAPCRQGQAGDAWGRRRPRARRGLGCHRLKAPEPFRREK
jgi:hypothetical protein